MVAIQTDQQVGVARPARFGKLPVVVALWGLGVAGWFAYLYSYSNKPGTDSPAPNVWPAESSIARNSERYTLLMFIHPHCPCTSASLGELARIMARCDGKADLHCVFVRPPGVPEGWEEGRLWNEAAAIGQVRLKVDFDGVEARRFKATTSGQVVVYDRTGAIVFDGGITGSRGHAGDNAGASAVIDWLQSGYSACRHTYVFGCSLF
jgi:hypothetical protein